MTLSAAKPFVLPQAAVAVDCVVFGVAEQSLKVLLVERGVEPFSGAWALPGGFVRDGESLEQAARRELKEETGLDQLYLEQLYTFGEPTRDPRGRVISVAYYALVKLRDYRTQPSADARQATWFNAAEVPNLAFDHGRIVEMARERLRGKVRYQPIGFELLPDKFTLTELQRLYEIILERELDKRNFRKKILSMDLLEDTGEMQKGVAHRAARLYAFDRKKYEKLTRKGFNFEL
jgi:8-oxo-dGTP diphosphatase